MKNIDKEIEDIANKMIKGDKKPASKKESKEPTTATGWLKKAYIDANPSDGAPKVGDIGYV